MKKDGVDQYMDFKGDIIMLNKKDQMLTIRIKVLIN